MVRSKSPLLNFETQQLRNALKAAYQLPYPGINRNIGSFTCGVYAFFDYDGEPIYVGQTFEGLSSRIGRHLTNQRWDAVAMSVLDPFEVAAIEMYPLIRHDGVKRNFKKSEGGGRNSQFDIAKSDLNALELAVFNNCIAKSRFNAILNEKDPALVLQKIEIPEPVRVEIVAAHVREIRDHPDIRIARRAQTIARLAQVISERDVSVGLRRALLVQARRLEHLARDQFAAWGGDFAMERKSPEAVESDGEDSDLS